MNRQLNKWLILFIIMSLLLVYSVARTFFGDPHINTDDALITNIYAKHFAESGTLYYNTHEKPVDGYTSFLDVLFKAFLYRFFFTDIVKAGLFASLLYHLLLLLSLSFFLFKIIYIYTKEKTDIPKYYEFFIALTGLSAFFLSDTIVDATMTYLETPLFLLAGFWAVYLLPINQIKKIFHGLFLLALIALTLTRPEGFLIAIILIVAYILIARFHLKQKTLQFNIAIIIAFFIILIIYFTWRIATFGYWAPNTYYAKTSALRRYEIIDGLQYLLAYGKHSIINIIKILFMLLMPLLSLLPRWSAPSARIKYSIIWIIMSVSLLATIYSGGDCYYESSRFLALPLILSLVGALYAIIHIHGRIKIVILVFLIIITVGDVVYNTKNSITIPQKYFFKVHHLFKADTNWLLKKVECQRQGIKKLAEIFPNVRVAQSDYQIFKLYADKINVIDLHGLNNKTIAHQKRLGHVLWGKYRHQNGIDVNADIWIFGFKNPNRESWVRYTISEVLEEEQLFKKFVGYESLLRVDHVKAITKNYRLASIPMCNDEKGSIYLNFLIRHDMVDKVKDDDFVMISKYKAGEQIYGSQQT